MRSRVVRNVRLTIEFDGAQYAGWQIQPDRPTVQGVLQKALRAVLGRDIVSYGCSRTDAGVSARNYVANFIAPLRLPVAKLAPALNANLPADIMVKKAELAALDFHARRRARWKTYSYSIVCGRSPLRRQHAWEFLGALEIDRLKKAARFFLGERDFGPFCYVRTGSGRCRITAIRVKAKGDEVTILITGDRFLYKMVRRIVGAMVAYASRRINLKDIRAALAGKPGKPFTAAPAQGLILEQVDY